jgi:cytochrome bd-type quinol oxidase subunit 1
MKNRWILSWLQPSMKKQENDFEIRIRKRYRFCYGNFTGGIEACSTGSRKTWRDMGPDYIPPVTISFWSFRIMVRLRHVDGAAGFLALASPESCTAPETVAVHVFNSRCDPAIYCQYLRMDPD